MHLQIAAATCMANKNDERFRLLPNYFDILGMPYLLFLPSAELTLSEDPIVTKVPCLSTIIKD